jgi:hypothetical protein
MDIEAVSMAGACARIETSAVSSATRSSRSSVSTTCGVAPRRYASSQKACTAG